MRTSDRVRRVQIAAQQCRDEADEIRAMYTEVQRRTEALQKRVERLGVETDRLLREYGIDPDNLPELEPEVEAVPYVNHLDQGGVAY